jgi:photoactive yellow protein
MGPDFEAPGVLAWLEAADGAALDALPYGAITMDAAGLVVHYNATESRAAGLSVDRLLGRDFFATIGICMNNAVVAERFAQDATIDVIIDYVLTLRMRPTTARLRLLHQAGAARRYLLVARR